VFFFAVGWWIWIDGHAYADKFETGSGYVTGFHYIPGIVSTISLILVNVINWKDLGGFSWGAEDGYQTRVRVWLFLSLVVAFGGIIAAVWIASVHWFSSDAIEKWPGIALITQNLLIFLSTMLFRFNTSPSDSEYSSF